jgi:hypothetical protein
VPDFLLDGLVGSSDVVAYLPFRQGLATLGNDPGRNAGGLLLGNETAHVPTLHSIQSKLENGLNSKFDDRSSSLSGFLHDVREGRYATF